MDARFKKSWCSLSQYLSNSTHLCLNDAIARRKYYVGLKQLGHVDVEMVIKTYGRLIPDNSTKSGYRPIHDWSSHLKEMVPAWSRDRKKLNLLL